MTITRVKKQNSVTVLHKGQGPSLFLPQSRPLLSLSEKPSKVNLVSAPTTPRSPISHGGRCGNRRFFSTGAQPPKRVVVQCVDKQDENSMFARRLRERAALLNRPTTATILKAATTPKSKKPAEQQQCELYLKERLFTNLPHKPANFPPPSFMPRWNPRHKDHTYASKLVLEDPWSLPAEKRTELKKRTGLRLKSLSRHYQYKTKANLPYGKDAGVGGSKDCACHINFCDHCQKLHEFRCPLHMQLLTDIEPDCKVQLGEFCPFSKNPEDLPLNQIQNPTVYISEVVRRLKAGEILQAPPFPSKFILEDPWKRKLNAWKNIPASANASAEALEHPDKKVVTEDSCTQTEPFIMDMDSKAAFRDNMSQTLKPDKESPAMVSSVLSSVEETNYLKALMMRVEMGTQVTPCMMANFKNASGSVVSNVARQTVEQAIQEISDEMKIQKIQTITATYTQELVDLQRTAQFKYLQEKWKANVYPEEHRVVEQETNQELCSEQVLCSLAFAQSYLWNFPGKAMDALRRQGFIVNQDLLAMDTVMREDMNEMVEEKLRKKDDSVKLLDEMINHALLDLELDAFRSNMVDEKYLNPLNWTTRFLREMLVLHDGNLETLRNIRAKLLADGWKINANGELVPVSGPGTGKSTEAEGSSGSSSSSDVSLDAFLKGVRVSMDSEGNPKYLVDVSGKPLPINVRWMPVMAEQLEQQKESRKNSWRFDIVLDDESLSDTQSEPEDGRGRKYGSRKKEEDDKDVEGEIEGLGLDLNYLEGDGEDDDEDDAGRLVFKRRDPGSDASDPLNYDYDDVNM